MHYSCTLDPKDSALGGTLDPRDSVLGGTLDPRDSVLQLYIGSKG